MPEVAGRRRGWAVAVAAALILLAAWLLLRSGGVPETAQEQTRIPPPARPAIEAPSRKAEAPAPVAPMAPVVVQPSVPAPPEEPPGLPLRVVVRDGTTGAPIAGASLVLLDRVRKGVRHPLRVVGTDHLLDPSPLRPGQEVGHAVEATLPEGYVKEQPGPLWIGGTSVGMKTESLEASLLVWPEARVRVRVEDPYRRFVAGAQVWNVRTGNREGMPGKPLTTDAGGEVLIQGIPAIPGEHVLAHAGIDGRVAVSERETIVDSRTEVLVPVVLPLEVPRESESPLPAGEATIELAGEAGKPLEGRSAAELRPPSATGSVLVRLFRTNGKPAAGVGVYVAGRRFVTDSEGVGRLAGIPTGAHWAGSGDVGFYVLPKRVEVMEGDEAVVELHENGARHDVVVVVRDCDGNPAPGASIEVRTSHGAPVCVYERGAQQLGLHTGPDGRCLLPDIPLQGHVSVRLGTRVAGRSIEHGGSVEIQLLVAPAPR